MRSLDGGTNAWVRQATFGIGPSSTRSLLRIVGRVRGLRVLDLGCGNGYLTRRWAREGAASSLGVDASAATLKFALQRERAHPSGAQFLRRNASHLTGLPAGSVDLVVANMALMDFRDGAVREVGRVLAHDGRFVFSICHPCFDLDDRSMWVTERHVFQETVWRKLNNYREERTARAPWNLSDTERAYTPDTTGPYRPGCATSARRDSPW